MLGGTNVQASAPEARDVLERGVADGIFFPWGSIFLFGIDKVTKYHIDAPLYSTMFAWSMNKAKYDAMSPAQKKVIDDHCTTEWAGKVAAPLGRFRACRPRQDEGDARPRGLRADAGQLEAWKKAAEPLTRRGPTASRRPAAIRMRDMKDSRRRWRSTARI